MQSFYIQIIYFLILLSVQFSSFQSLSHVQLFVTPWTVAHHAPLSVEFSRQEYWSGLPFPSSVDLPNPGIEPGSPALQPDSLPLSHQESPFWTRTPNIKDQKHTG